MIENGVPGETVRGGITDFAAGGPCATGGPCPAASREAGLPDRYGGYRWHFFPGSLLFF